MNIITYQFLILSAVKYIFLVQMQQTAHQQKQQQCNTEGKIFLNADLLLQGAKLLTPDRSSGENTRSKLAEHASSTFRWFLHFLSKNNEFFQVLWSSTV